MKILFLVSLIINTIFAMTNLNIQETKIYEVTGKTAKIDIINTQIGQSGIIVKTIENNLVIIQHAVISQSNEKYSTITFTKTPVLAQEAIPTSSYKPSTNDTFILNHLYNTSLLIVPNTNTKNIIKKMYPDQNFLNEDFFASHLKLIHTPVPDKKTFVDFTLKQQIGTIFIVIEDNLYILDGSTFTIIDTIKIKNDDKTQNIPFLTKVTNIESSFWDFEDKTMNDYSKYYLKLLEVK